MRSQIHTRSAKNAAAQKALEVLRVETLEGDQEARNIVAYQDAIRRTEALNQGKGKKGTGKQVLQGKKY